MAVATSTALLVGGLSALAAGTAAYSAREQRKASEKAAQAELDAAQTAANKQVEAQKEAQTTARMQLRAAQAKKSDTILTKKDEDTNVSRKSILG